MAEEKDMLVIEGDDVENMYLVFEVADERYAVNIGYVTEIVGMQRISAIPDVPIFIKGAMNLRGKVIPVMDMHLRFGLPWREYDDRTTLIVLNLEGIPTALVVDRVSDVLTISPDKIDPPTHWQGDGEKGMVLGLGKLDNQVSIILNVPRLIYDKEVHIEPVEINASPPASDQGQTSTP
jgi:purine-binding chemotaxis protein CheW